MADLRNYDIYLFDWDGTLADSTQVWLQAFRNVLTRRYGLHHSDRQFARAMGDWRLLIPLGVPAADLPAVCNEISGEAVLHLPDAPLFPGARKTLELLKRQQKKLGVVTAMHRHIIADMVAHHGFQAFFDIVVNGDDVRATKPDPEGIHLALRHVGAGADSRALFLGDAERDLLAARAAGINSSLFFPPAHKVLHEFDKLQACGPTFILRNWEEALDQLS